MTTGHIIKPPFKLGQTVATAGAIDALERNQKTATELLNRHSRGDWGDLDDDDKELNDDAVKNGGRILSAYWLPDETKIWIITEAADDLGDRSATTLLLPEDY